MPLEEDTRRFIPSSGEASSTQWRMRYLQSSSHDYHQIQDDNTSPVLLAFAVVAVLACKFGCYLCAPQRRRLLTDPTLDFTMEARRRRRRRIRERRLREMGVIQDDTSVDAAQRIQITAEQAEKRRRSLLATFDANKVQMKIEQENLVGAHKDEEAQDEDPKIYDWIRLTDRKPPQPLLVPNSCVICLDSFAVREVIVWSNNEKCHHAFHQDCITEYLVPLKSDHDSPCPCCRQSFCIEIVADKISGGKKLHNTASS